jgi:hypothetical protein
VFRPILVEDEGVIHIKYQTIIGEMPQDIIHHPHEICLGICQAKGHDQPFKNTFFGFDYSIPYIGLLYRNLVVVGHQMNLPEVFFPLELVKDIINLGNWRLVPDFYFI